MSSNIWSRSRTIENLLLNRINGLRWMYYDIDLNEEVKLGNDNRPILLSGEEVVELFKHIEIGVFGNDSYTGKASNSKPINVFKILATILKQNPKLIKNATKRIFDVNEISNKSTATQGLLGVFNDKDRVFRNKKFKKKIRDGFRKNPDSVVILAEGDSWFQFPRVYLGIDPVKDIIDWLGEEEWYAIYSLAAAGDWFSNVIHSGEYIEELPKVSPDVFLISGGGNDLLGDNRLGSMVIYPGQQQLRNNSDPLFQALTDKRAGKDHIDLEKYKIGLAYISDEFFEFMNVFFVQLFVFFSNLANIDQYKNMAMITQGYDFVLPYNGSRANATIVQRVINEFVDTGTWLYEPLNMKGICDSTTQEAIMYTMITEFNEMMISLATFQGFPNLYHIDCRGVARNEDDWFDEIHLKAEAFATVAKAYKHTIECHIKRNGSVAKKIIQAKSFWVR